MGNDYQYLPEAEGVGQRLNLNALPAPPAGYRFLGYKTIAQASARRPQKADLVRWCEFYLWGFDINLGSGRKADLEKALRKLMFYTAPRHVPQNYTEFDACVRDAGPRLLDYTKIPWNAPEVQLRDHGLWYAPISRLYPHPPNGSAPTHQQYSRPADAPPPWNDAWVEQALLSSEPRSNANVNANDTPANFVDIASQLAKSNGLPQGIRQEVQEAIQKSMIRIVYADLERHPTAASRQPPQHIIAATEHDLLQAIMTSSRATSQVRLSEDGNGKLFINRAGQLWSIKDRGPTYSSDSAVIDCVITVGTLLDAGSTNADREDPQWHAKSSSLQRGFIELSDVNWDLCGRDSGAKMKQVFREMIKQEKSDFGDSNPDSLAFLWNAVANGLGQFTITQDRHSYGCDCLEAAPSHCKLSSPFITPEVDLNVFVETMGLNIQDLFDRMFKSVETTRCLLCQKYNARLEKNFRKLPLRLAVKSQPGVPILEHTKDVTVKYRLAGNVNQGEAATYRWLGGIYRDGTAYRVYWRTAKRGEEQSDQISMYDSSNHGLIVARSPKTEYDSVIRKKWIPELLFYERVLNPSADVLSEALLTVSQMWSDEKKGVLTLNNTQPWTTTEKPRGPISGYPWKPQQISKPPDAQRFQLASGAYIPSSHYSTTSEVPESLVPRPLTSGSRKRSSSWVKSSTGENNHAAGAYDQLMELYSPPPPGEEKEESMSPDSMTSKRRKSSVAYPSAVSMKSSKSATPGPAPEIGINFSNVYSTAGIVKKISVDQVSTGNGCGNEGDPSPDPGLLLEYDAEDDDEDVDESLGGSSLDGIGILPGLLRRKPDMKEDIARLGRGGLINETEKSAYNPDNESDINDGFTGSDEDDEDESDDDDEEEAGTQTGVMSQYAMNQYQMGIERRAAASPHSTSQPGARGVGASQRSASMGGAGGNTTGAVTNADSDITMEDRFELPGSAGNSNGGTNRQLSK